MKVNMKQQTNLVNEGRKNWERTHEFNKKANEIKREILNEYHPLLMSERNWVKRLFIRFSIWLETKKRIGGLSSNRNLHMATR